MINKNKQQGMTAIAIVLLLSVLAFFVYLGLRLFPVYMEGFKVDTAISTIVNESATSEMSVVEIKKSILRRLDIDDVDSVKSENIIVEKQGGNIKITVEYDRYAPITDSMDVVVYFLYEAEG